MAPAVDEAHEDERQSEIQILQSILGEEYVEFDGDQLRLTVDIPEDDTDGIPYKILLEAVYPASYPDEPAEISLQPLEGNLDEAEVEYLTKDLEENAQESLGMAMLYTLVLRLQDNVSQMTRQRHERIEKAESDRRQAIEDEIARQKSGTQVTKENFFAWRDAFEKERAQKIRAEQEEGFKALSAKEREEQKRIMARLSGRQLFERGRAKENETDQFGDDNAAEVDMHVSHDAEDDKQEVNQGVANIALDSDSE